MPSTALLHQRSGSKALLLPPNPYLSVALQALVLHNPVVLSLLDAPKDAAGGGNGLGASAEIQHFRLDCAPADRLLVTMALLKLGSIKRKVRAPRA